MVIVVVDALLNIGLTTVCIGVVDAKVQSVIVLDVVVPIIVDSGM
jgi:hypothetical protein